jgi:hypothetical protein
VAKAEGLGIMVRETVAVVLPNLAEEREAEAEGATIRTLLIMRNRVALVFLEQAEVEGEAPVMLVLTRIWDREGQAEIGAVILMALAVPMLPPQILVTLGLTEVMDAVEAAEVAVSIEMVDAAEYQAEAGVDNRLRKTAQM